MGASADVCQHLYTLAFGRPNETFGIGPPTKAGVVCEALSVTVPAVVHTLRVGYAGRSYPSDATRRVLATLTVPDEATLIEGIEVPFTLPVEAPVRLTLSAEGMGEEDEPVQVLATILEGTIPATRYSATRSDLVAADAFVALQTWTQGVFLHATAATGTWRDSAGAVIGTFGSGIWSPRPRQAGQVLVSAADSLLTQGFST
jgi:hypothetical protein